MKAPWLPFSMFRAGGTFIFHSHGRWALEGWEGYLIYNRLKNCNIINILLLISFLKSSSFSYIGHCWFMLYLFLFLTRGLCFRRDLFISRLLCTYSYCSDDICSYDTCPTDNCSAWSDKYSGDKMLPERHLLLQKSNDSWSSKKKIAPWKTNASQTIYLSWVIFFVSVLVCFVFWMSEQILAEQVS